jgi:hypothetical protein
MRRWLACALLPLLLAACGRGEATRGAATAERDSAGVRIIESDAPPAAWRLAEPAELRVGVESGAAAYQLHQVRLAARLRDGGLAVVDGASREVRFFDGDGRHLRSVGRRGAGPGEFDNITAALLLPGDTLLLLDARNRRLTRVPAAGDSLREQPLPPQATGALRLVGARPDGRVVLAAEPPVPFPERMGYSYVRAPLALLVVDAEAAQADTVATVDGADGVYWADDSGGMVRVTNVGLPFGYAPAYALSGSEVVLTWDAGASLAVLDDAGRLVRIVRRRDAPPQPVGRELRERYVAWMGELARERGAPAAEAEAAARDRLGAAPAGHMVPHFDRVAAAPDGGVWVRSASLPWERTAAQQWTLHARNGAAVARLEVPAALTVTQFGTGHVTGVLRDALGIESVASYRIER